MAERFESVEVPECVAGNMMYHVAADVVDLVTSSVYVCVFGICVAGKKRVAFYIVNVLLIVVELGICIFAYRQGESEGSQSLEQNQEVKNAKEAEKKANLEKKKAAEDLQKVEKTIQQEKIVVDQKLSSARRAQEEAAHTQWAQAQPNAGRSDPEDSFILNIGEDDVERARQDAKEAERESLLANARWENEKKKSGESKPGGRA